MHLVKCQVGIYVKEHAIEYADVWHYMPSRYERAGGFWLVRAGRNLAKPNYRVGPKQIDSFGLHIIMEGRLTLRYGHQEIELGANDLFCLFPLITYEYRICGDERLRMAWLTMEGPQMRELLKMLGVTAHKPYRYAAMDEMALQHLRDLEQTLVESAGGQRRLALMSAVYRLLAQLELEPGRFKSGGADEAPEGWVHEAVRFLHLHYTEPLRIEAVAGMFGVHRSYFSQFFRQKLGRSPQQYLQELRLSRAKQLLSDQTLPIGEIAQSAGYPDLYTFSRAFKKHIGCSPSEYRRQGG